MKGRKQKPTALKLLQGNPGRRPLNKQEPKPKRNVRAPDGLSPGAKKEWRRLGPELRRLGLLTMADQAIFAMYCETVAVFYEARDGRDPHARNGSMLTMEKAAAQGRAFATLFGLSPSDRTRLKSGPDDDESYLDELVFGINAKP
jgi:phage terminase small subunit